MICLQIIGNVVSASRLLTRTHLVNNSKTRKDDRKASDPKMYFLFFSAWDTHLNTHRIHEMVDKTYLFVIILHSDFLKLQYEAYSQNKCNANQKPCCFFFFNLVSLIPLKSSNSLRHFFKLLALKYTTINA